MNIDGKKIGVGITGSFCTFSKAKEVINELVDKGAIVIPVFSFNACVINTRFDMASEYVKEIEEICGNTAITTIEGAEPIGPKKMLDIFLILPCTGNTLAKLANGITDTPVLMAAKAHLRNDRPVVVAVSTNDALGASLKNIGLLINTKNYYFVPFGQDNYDMKPKSMVARMDKVVNSVENALDGLQTQPIIEAPIGEKK